MQDNEQLILYALGAINMVTEAADGEAAAFITVRTTVVQPRGFHGDGPIRSTCYIQQDMDEWDAKVMESITLEKESDETVLIPGEEQCQWCPAKAVCEARQEWKAHSVFKVLDNGADPGLWSKPITELNEAEVKDILDNADNLVDRINQVKAMQIESIMAGGSDLDYKVTRSQTKRTFKLSTEETTTLLNKKFKFKKVDIERKQLQTIGELDKLAKTLSESRRKEYNELFIKPEGSLQLVHKSAKGRAIEPAVKVFQPVDPQQPEVIADFDFLA